MRLPLPDHRTVAFPWCDGVGQSCVRYSLQFPAAVGRSKLMQRRKQPIAVSTGQKYNSRLDYDMNIKR